MNTGDRVRVVIQPPVYVSSAKCFVGKLGTVVLTFPGCALGHLYKVEIDDGDMFVFYGSELELIQGEA